MATGQQIVDLAMTHLGEDYVLGASARLDRPWDGPWDCSLFVSKMVFEAAGIVYGAIGEDPATADPYTGAWAEDARSRGIIIPVDRAAATPGAALLRIGARIGHIVISRGDGSTVEAMGSAYGVCVGQVENRRWALGVLVPGIDYGHNEPLPLPPLPKIFRIIDPPMANEKVREIQRALLRAGFNPQDLDGIYGWQTANAVIRFQRSKGLVADGEVGPVTLAALGIIKGARHE